jgi:hypothetical protein
VRSRLLCLCLLGCAPGGDEDATPTPDVDSDPPCVQQGFWRFLETDSRLLGDDVYYRSDLAFEVENLIGLQLERDGVPLDVTWSRTGEIRETLRLDDVPVLAPSTDYLLRFGICEPDDVPLRFRTSRLGEPVSDGVAAEVRDTFALTAGPNLWRYARSALRRVRPTSHAFRCRQGQPVGRDRHPSPDAPYAGSARFAGV